jgi:hypothetical protein
MLSIYELRSHRLEQVQTREGGSERVEAGYGGADARGGFRTVLFSSEGAIDS